MNKKIAVLFVIILFILYFSGVFEQKYVLITVDTESDMPPYLDSYKGIEEGMPKLLDLLDEYNVKGTFFITGDIAEKYPDIVLEIKNRGHKIGSHGFYHEDFNTLTYDQKTGIIENSTNLLENLTGEDIVLFRAPYHSGSTELTNILEENGYIIEASGTSSQLYPHPYHPSKDDWLKEGDMKILRVPISLTPYYFYPSSFYKKSWISGYDYASSRDDIIVIGMHPWEFVEMSGGPEEYTRTSGDYSYNSLKELLEYLKNKNVKYITMRELYEMMS